jgi:hypothetical protein
MTMDYKNIMGQAEYAKRKTDTRLIPDTTSWYVMLGYRVGKFVPYYVHGNAKQDSIRSFSGLPTTGPLAPLSAGVNGAIKAGLQSTNAVGVRWDFYKSPRSRCRSTVSAAGRRGLLHQCQARL